MARQRHLSRAPITEALIDIRVSPRGDLSFAALQQALDSSEFGYYTKGPITQISGQIEFKISEPTTSAATQQVGMRFHSRDEKFVAQCQINGFTLSRLPPYENWDNLTSEASRIWRYYADHLSPKGVTRIATRFINNLRLPMQTGASYQMFLNKFVDLPQEAPQAVETFFQRFQLLDTETGDRVILTLTLGGGSAEGILPVILDVDAFATADLAPSAREMWAILERLRELKNRCFFGTLTEQAAELYE